MDRLVVAPSVRAEYERASQMLRDRGERQVRRTRVSVQEFIWATFCENVEALCGQVIEVQA